MNKDIKQLFDFDDFLIEPTVLSSIKSRSEISIKDDLGRLPIMTAPMDTVINHDNVHYFENNNIIPVLPRVHEPTKDYLNYYYFLSYSLQDFKRLFLEKKITIPEGKKIYTLIDVANGHMLGLYNAAKEAKELYGNEMFLMIGNVANPETFREYCKIGVDAIRIGIGNGNGCLTSVQTGVGYPMASLINECYNIKKDNNFFNTLIVADGGFKKYADIIKALALGADYVMLGSILNKALESAGETQKRRNSTLGGWETIDQYSDETKQMFNANIELRKIFRGMSTKDVQKSWGKNELTTSEGIVKNQMVEYTLEGWVKNFEDYFKSAMSYTGKKKLHEFIGGVRLNFISMNSFRRFDK